MKMAIFAQENALKTTESDNWLHYTLRILPLRRHYALTTLLTARGSQFLGNEVSPRSVPSTEDTCHGLLAIPLFHAPVNQPELLPVGGTDAVVGTLADDAVVVGSHRINHRAGTA